MPYIGATLHYFWPCETAHENMKQTIECEFCREIKCIKLGAVPFDGFFEETKSNDNINNNRDVDISVDMNHSDSVDVEVDDNNDNDRNDVNINNDNKGNDIKFSNNQIIDVEKSDVVEISAVELHDELRDKVIWKFCAMSVNNADMCYLTDCWCLFFSMCV